MGMSRSGGSKNLRTKIGQLFNLPPMMQKEDSQRQRQIIHFRTKPLSIFQWHINTHSTLWKQEKKEFYGWWITKSMNIKSAILLAKKKNSKMSLKWLSSKIRTLIFSVNGKMNADDFAKKWLSWTLYIYRRHICGYFMCYLCIYYRVVSPSLIGMANIIFVPSIGFTFTNFEIPCRWLHS